MLQQVNSLGLEMTFSIMGDILSAFKNLVFVCIVFNWFDCLLPYMLFSQLLVATSFWTLRNYHLHDFYYNVFNSKFSLFNLLRMSLAVSTDASSSSLFKKYNLNYSFFHNIIGEFVVFIIVLVTTLTLFLVNSGCNSERVREIVSKLRGIWNGFIFSLMPRVIILSSLQLRNLNEPTVSTIANGCLACLVIGLFIVFIVFFIIQIHKIITSLESIEEDRCKIGIGRKLMSLSDFQFDCLQFSNLYYPAINYIRIMFSCLCVGFAPDLHYVQIGGIIMSQTFYLIINICSRGHKKSSDNILCVIVEFIMLVILLRSLLVIQSSTLFTSPK